jgi:hypothetical protein
MARGKKEKTIILVTPSGEKQEFGLQHAERLLDMGSALNGGWKVDPASNYYYDEENGIRLKANKGNSAKA